MVMRAEGRLEGLRQREEGGSIPVMGNHEKSRGSSTEEHPSEGQQIPRSNRGQIQTQEREGPHAEGGEECESHALLKRVLGKHLHDITEGLRVRSIALVSASDSLKLARRVLALKGGGAHGEITLRSN